MPTIRKEMRRRSGEMVSNRYELRRFTSAERMHRFLNTGDNALFWKETPHDLPSGFYTSQVSVCRETRKAKETLHRIK